MDKPRPFGVWTRSLSSPGCWILGILLLWALGSACTGTDRKVLPPQVLFKKARRAIQVENYEKAQEYLNQLMEDSPDSKERVLAQLLLADVYYKQELYEEAKFNYGKFLELYPLHKLAPRAQYFKAMTEFRRIDIATRDQTFTHNAKAEFEKLVRVYPKSAYAAKAKEKIKRCISFLAENELEIGRFYYRTSAYQSAISRFKGLLKEYPEQSFRDEVLFLLGESYREEENYENARQYFRQLLREHPRSEFTHEARARLRELPRARP